MMPRYARPRMVDAMPGFRDQPLRGGRRRPESLCRSCEHRRPRGLEGAQPGRFSCAGNVTTPMGSGERSPFAGRPTARKVQIPSGCRMTQEAKAGTPKGTRNPEARQLHLPAVVSDQLAGYGAMCPDLKGCPRGSGESAWTR
jgi:hypothetical protein